MFKTIRKSWLFVFLILLGLVVGQIAHGYITKASEVKLTPNDKLIVASNIQDASLHIIEQFNTHDIVAIGDAHFYDEVMQYTTKLVTSEAFAKKCRHLIVEFGNRKYQTVVDRYINGEAVSDNELSQVWQDTLFFTAWTPEVYGDFFRAIRAFNTLQPTDQKLKVTLAETAFDWQSIESSQQWQSLADNKVSGFNETIQSTVKAGDKALLIFGAFHTIELSDFLVDKIDHRQKPLVTRLAEQNYKVYSVWPVIQKGIMAMLDEYPSASTPGLIDAKHSKVSELYFAEVFPKARTKLREMDAADAKVKDLFDGLLYLGNIERNMQFPKALLSDDTFINQSKARVALIGGRVEKKFNEVLEASVE